MNYRSAYIRHARKGLRLKKRVAVVALLGVAACSAALLLQREPARGGPVHGGAAAVSAAAPGLTIAPQVESNGTRRIYPYSVVAGGVQNRAELARVVHTDKVVAAHYASFQVDKAHPVTVAAPRSVHVSYRKGDQVYWTRNKVKLAEGEILLSDGSSEIRGRCGNRISDTAMLPVEAAAPSEQDLDASVEEDQDGKLNVSAPAIGAGAGQGSYPLMTFPNGAGLLAVSGGEGWHAPGSPFGGMAGSAYPGTSYGSPVLLSGGQAASSGTTPAASAPANSGGSAPAESVAALDTATSSGATSETPRSGAAAGNDNGSGGTTVGLPVALPIGLTDTVQPEPTVDIKTPQVPDVLLTPGELPTVPANADEQTAQAPEPSSLWLGGLGIAAMCLLRRRRRTA